MDRLVEHVSDSPTIIGFTIEEGSGGIGSPENTGAVNAPPILAAASSITANPGFPFRCYSTDDPYFGCVGDARKWAGSISVFEGSRTICAGARAHIGTFAIAAGEKVLRVTTQGFNNFSDIVGSKTGGFLGSFIVIPGAGPHGANLVSVIARWVSGGNVIEIEDAAHATVSGDRKSFLYWGPRVFEPSDVGGTVAVESAFGPEGSLYSSIINEYHNPLQVSVERPAPANYGPTGTLYIGTDDSEALIHLAKAALERGDRIIHVAKSHLALNVTPECCAFSWLGEGELYGTCMYIPVAHWTSPEPPTLQSSIVPNYHLRQMKAAMAADVGYTVNNIVIVSQGAGGIAGTYTGGVLGGPVEFSWTYTIGPGGFVTNANVTNPGMAPATDPLILSFSEGGINGAIAKAHCGAISVMAGDSQGTIDPDAFSQQYSIHSLLDRRVRNCNPGKSHTMINRAIGGGTWHSLSGAIAPMAYPEAWWPEADFPTTKWMDKIQQCNPDTIFINLAANDGRGFILDHMLSCLEYFRSSKYHETCGKTPDIILITSWGHGQQAAPTTAAAGLGIDGTGYAAGIEASYAEMNGIGVLDTFSQAMLVNQGFSQFLVPLKADHFVAPQMMGSFLIDLPFTWPQKCYGFSLCLKLNGREWPRIGNELRFMISGARNFRQHGNIFRLGLDGASGFLYYQCDTQLIAMGAESDRTCVARTLTDYRGDGEDIAFNFSLVGNEVMITMADRTVLFKGLVERFGGPSFPVVSCGAGDVVSALSIDNPCVYAHALSGVLDKMALCRPLFSETETHGWVGPDWTGIPRSPYGGSGGHSGRLAGINIFGRLIDANNFSVL